MKIWTKLSAVTLAVVMVLMLASCGGSSDTAAETSTTAAPETTTQAPTEAPAETGNVIEAGTFTFTYVDVYGDETEFTVTLKDTGKAFVMYKGALGSETLSADNWTDNGDGSFTIDPLNGELDTEFVSDDGTTTWIPDGESVTPAGYTEPTEFIEKEVKDPTTKAEAVGAYIFGFQNAYGAVVPYVLYLKGDGTFTIAQKNAFMGFTVTYSGQEWSMDGNTAVLGPCTEYEAGEEPRNQGNGATFFTEDTYESSWTLRADGTACPVGAEDVDKTGDIDLSDIEELIPADMTACGIYTFGFKNAYGAISPYVLWVNGDGTWNIFQPNAFMQTIFAYSGDEWDYDADTRTVSLGPCTVYAEGEPPKTAGNGAYWFTDDTFQSSYVLNDDGLTCTPAGAEDDTVKLDDETVAGLDESIYPKD